MVHPGRGKCQKRKRDSNVPIQVVDCTPLQLWAWWNDMRLIEQGIIFKYLDFLTRIIQVEPKRDVIKALLSFWNPTNNVFRFSNFEMTPTLKEIAGFTGFGVRYGREDGFKKFGRTLNNKESFETWKEHRRFAFMVAFLGTMVFPRRGGKINIFLTEVVNVLIQKNNYTIVPMILADIYRALTVCQKGKRFFEGCNILLQLWIVEHLYRPPTVERFIQDRSDYITSHAKRVEKCRCPKRVNAWVEHFCSLTKDKITWNYLWFSWVEVIHMSSARPFLLLMGVRGVQPYVPLQVLRQLGRRQVLPITKDMKDFVFEVEPEVPLPEGLAQKIWDGCLVMGIGTMVKERHTGETHPEYSNWLEQQPRLQVRPERSVKEPIDHEAEMKIKIESAMREYLTENQELRAYLELARAALTQQQTEFEEERDKATQRETLLRGQVDFATIRGAQVAELAVSRQQQLRTCDQKNQINFDQKRAQWIRERGRLREEIESVSTQERRAREMVASCDQQIR
ncbi:hypothetical protein KY290_013858 [Solanum tuberosum]|uniref:Aminotransferase-like plant mobile domain-containing protein n=1 Tax=Solanum tuberosum TaxID=4113 RepID=A0ABQ7VQP7_SOLTU|nr:hypothetical protein KY289_013968 [Solanum tuberosum]KAH0769877.1 hypothetical protein KY290_013858 [Solanum tuberosum]